MAAQVSTRITRRQFLTSTALTAGAAATALVPGARGRAAAAQARLLVLPVPEGERRGAGELRQGVGEEEQRGPPDLDGAVEGVHAEDHRGHRGQGDPRRRRVGRRRAPSRGQLLEVTDIYKKLEKAHGGWVGPSSKFMLEPDGRVHTILYGLQGFMLVGRDDLVKGAGLTPPPATWVDLLAYAKKVQQPPKTFGLGHPREQPDGLPGLGRHHEELRGAPRGSERQADHPRRLQEGRRGSSSTTSPRSGRPACCPPASPRGTTR